MSDFDDDDIECARCRKVIPEDQAVPGTGPLWPMWFCPECGEIVNPKPLEVAA